MYWAMLLVKDFNAPAVPGEALPVDQTFMTNADVPILASHGINMAPLPRNPFTGNPLASVKEEGATITTTHLWQIRKHARTTFTIKPDEWLHVRDDIFNMDNWSRVKQ
jgi:hypothetical protein